MEKVEVRNNEQVEYLTVHEIDRAMATMRKVQTYLREHQPERIDALHCTAAQFQRNLIERYLHDTVRANVDGALHLLFAMKYEVKNATDR